MQLRADEVVDKIMSDSEQNSLDLFRQSKGSEQLQLIKFKRDLKAWGWSLDYYNAIIHKWYSGELGYNEKLQLEMFCRKFDYELGYYGSATWEDKSASDKQSDKLLGKSFTTKQESKQSDQVSLQANQESVQVTKQTYGSMKKPVKTITIDIYQETDVNVEQRQKQIAQLIAQLKQLQETKVTVDPKYKVIVR